MNNTATVNKSSGIWFTGLLQIVFIVLKLTGYIAWSWFWVLAPMWISVAIAVAFILLIVAIALISSIFD